MLLQTNELLRELSNESFSFVFHDNGYRPEITVARPAFYSEINDYYVQALVQDGEMWFHVSSLDDNQLDDDEELPEKCTSEVSILNVYDTYGLDISLVFLRYLRLHKIWRRHWQWLHVYLEACTFVLGIEVRHKTGWESEQDIEHMI